MATWRFFHSDESFDQLEPSWRPKLVSALQSIPSQWNGYNVTLLITSVVGRGKHAAKSMHYKGLAVDLNIVLNGATVRTGNIGTASPSDVFTAPDGRQFRVAAIYSELLGNAANSIEGRWGGGFGGGVKPYYDPMHIDGGKGSVAPNFKLSEDGDSAIEVTTLDENVVPPNATITDGYSLDAGSESKVESGSVSTSARSNTSLYIGYDLTLSDFKNVPFGETALGNILDAAGVSVENREMLVKACGVRGNDAFDLYTKYSGLSITEENAVSILSEQVLLITKYLKDSKGFDCSSYPKEISTAIVSYFFGKNMATAKNVEELTEMIELVKSSESSEVAKQLARYIETKSIGLASDVKSRRASEAALLRSYDPDKSQGYASTLTTTNSKSDYDSEESKLRTELTSQMDEIRGILGSRKSSGSEPASQEYDDTFNDVEQSTLDAVASIMQSQQSSTDVFFGNKEGEYFYRMKTKNFYTTLSRVLNYKISSIDKLVEDEDLLKDHKEFKNSSMYAMIPYSTGIAYTVKSNAVKRCEYRIRVIEKEISNHESDLVGFGCPSTNSYLDIGSFIAMLPIRLGVSAAGAMIDAIGEIFGTLGTLRMQLKLEKGNLAALKKDLHRYS